MSARPTRPATDTADRPPDWSSDKWATPPDLIVALSDRFGPFNLDPCAESATAKAPRYYTEADNGLTQRWFGTVFVNPPYSNPKAWCARSVEAIESGEADRVVLLLPAATDTAWFHDLVWPNADLVFLRGRVRFLGWRGTPIPAPRSPSLVAVIDASTLGRGKVVSP